MLTCEQNNEPVKVAYVLVDLAGGIEGEEMMTAQEAKNRNEALAIKQPRFLKWIPKQRQVNYKFGYQK